MTLPEDVGVQALPSVPPLRGLGASGLLSLCFLPALPWGSHHLLRLPPEAGRPDLGACLTPCKHPKSIRDRKRKGSWPPPSPRPEPAPRYSSHYLGGARRRIRTFIDALAAMRAGEECRGR